MKYEAEEQDREIEQRECKEDGEKMEWKRTEKNRFWGKKKSPPVCTFWVSPS